LLNPFPEGCQLCSFAASIASLVQFYTQEQTPSNGLQCKVSSTCVNNAGPCCNNGYNAESGLGACISVTDCLMTLAVSSIHWQGAVLSLKNLTGKNELTGGRIGPLSYCKDEEFPDGRVTAYPDASGETFWYVGAKLQPDQLDKVLASGSPVIIRLKYERISTTFAFIVAAKSASNYTLWSPSTEFNPDQLWKFIDYDGISQMSFTTQDGSGPPEWVHSFWGGSSYAIPC